MIDVALGVMLVFSLIMVMLLLVFALITIIDQKLDGLITKKIKKRFGGDE